MSDNPQSDPPLDHDTPAPRPSRLHAVATPRRAIVCPLIDPSAPVAPTPLQSSVAASLSARGIGEDEVLAWVAVDGASTREIAQALDVSKTALLRWLHGTLDRSARFDAAWRECADARAEEALEVLRVAAADKTLTRAQAAMTREIAHHLRWEASVRNRDRYGDHVRVDQRVQVGRGVAQMSDAELLEIARKSGVSGPLIDGWAETVETNGVHVVDVTTTHDVDK